MIFWKVGDRVRVLEERRLFLDVVVFSGFIYEWGVGGFIVGDKI